MFNRNFDERLSVWSEHRKELEQHANPLQAVWEFWKLAPFVPLNRNIDPYYQDNWPTPWEIIEDNKYDDFTKSLMIGWTLKLTKKFKDSKIELKTMIDINRTREYNVIYIDDTWAINYSDHGPILILEINEELAIKNLIELASPR